MSAPNILLEVIPEEVTLYASSQSLKTLLAEKRSQNLDFM